MIESWGTLKNIILYGAGTVGFSCIRKMRKDFEIDFIMDNDEKKEGVFGSRYDVVNVENGLKRRKSQKIIVMTGGRAYDEIASDLKQSGLKETIDFCGIEDFLEKWYWQNKHENCILELHMALTMNCTLKCKDCNMFVPYYPREVAYPLERIKKEIDLLFSYVDCVLCLTFLGGEPLLYKDLKAVVLYVAEKYGENVSSIKIVTNGTVTPDNEFIEAIKGLPVWFSISDYTQHVPYDDKLKKFEKLLDDNGIAYQTYHTKRWCDFGFPSSPIFYEEAACEKHRKACGPIFHGYNDGKIYYCHDAWRAEKIGRFTLKESDYVDLNHWKENQDRHIISEHCNGKIKNGYVSFCQVCGGCGYDNKKLVDAGVQVE